MVHSRTTYRFPSNPMTQNTLFAARMTLPAAGCRPITRPTQGLDFRHHDCPSIAPDCISREHLKAPRDVLRHFVLCFLFCLVCCAVFMSNGGLFPFARPLQPVVGAPIIRTYVLTITLTLPHFAFIDRYCITRRLQATLNYKSTSLFESEIALAN